MARTFSPTSLFNFFMIINLISQASSLKFWLIAMEWPFKWSLPAPLLWQFSSFTKICLEVLRNMDFYHWRGKRWGCAPSLDKARTWGKFWSSTQSPESWLNQGSNMANIIYFFWMQNNSLSAQGNINAYHEGSSSGTFFPCAGRPVVHLFQKIF